MFWGCFATTLNKQSWEVGKGRVFFFGKGCWPAAEVLGRKLFPGGPIWNSWYQCRLLSLLSAEQDKKGHTHRVRGSTRFSRENRLEVVVVDFWQCVSERKLVCDGFGWELWETIAEFHFLKIKIFKNTEKNKDSRAYCSNPDEKIKTKIKKKKIWLHYCLQRKKVRSRVRKSRWAVRE